MKLMFVVKALSLRPCLNFYPKKKIITYRSPPSYQVFKIKRIWVAMFIFYDADELTRDYC